MAGAFQKRRICFQMSGEPLNTIVFKGLKTPISALKTATVFNDAGMAVGYPSDRLNVGWKMLESP
jgi:hypothetical protein